MSSRATTAALTATLLLASGAYVQAAEPDTGLYIGGGLTQSRFDNDDFSIDDIKDEDNSWKAIIGFRPSPHFALEGNYVNFGKSQAPATSPGGPFAARAEGFAAFGVGLIPVGPVELYGKVGASRIETKVRVGTTPVDKDNATQFAYGAGIQFRLGSFGLRAEYEKYDTDGVGDLDLITAGFTFNFGPRS